MRTTKELFEFLLEQSKESRKNFFPADSICNLMYRLRMKEELTIEEYRRLLTYMHDHYINSNRIDNVSLHYWWPKGQWEPRTQWIVEQITLLS